MNTLQRYELNFDRTIEFVRDNLNIKNILSSELLKLTNFESGVFFTLLTDGSDLQRLYEFEAGAILPQHPLIITETNGKQSFSREKASIKNELSHYIFQKLNNNKKFSCIFDDVMSNPRSPYLKKFYKSKSIYLYESEVILVIQEQNKNCEFILDCMWIGFSIWHSIGILTEADCFKNDNALTLEDIQTICRKTKLILIGAYDGEGYVLWEKKE